VSDDDGVRSAAFASLVTALVGVRPDPATARFDAELAAAEAAGVVDPSVARTLRWWQRESVRGVAEHLEGVLPAVLTSLETAERAALDTVTSSASSWAAATESEGGPPLPPPDPDPGSGTPADRGAPPASGPAGAARRPPADPGGAPYLRPVDIGPATTPAPPAPRLLRPGFAPPSDTPPTESPTPPSAVRPDGPVAHDSGPGGAPPRRLLVAGLTVLPDDGDAPRSTAARDRSQHDRTTTTHDDVPGTSG
jgi:hypothetical protein